MEKSERIKRSLKRLDKVIINLTPEQKKKTKEIYEEHLTRLIEKESQIVKNC